MFQYTYIRVFTTVMTSRFRPFSDNYDVPISASYYLYVVVVMLLENNTGEDQPAHPRSWISAFVIRFLEGMIDKIYSG